MKLSLIVFAAVASGLPAQDSPRPERDRPGPWDNDVLVWRLAPGDQPQHLATFERAGVPTAARLKDGRLVAAFQHFPKDDDRNFDRVAVRFSSDEGRTWSAPEPIAVAGMAPGLARPFDPTLVPLPDGRVRIYFTSNQSPDFRASTPAIYSAISKDAVRYEFEPGVRFAIEGRIVIDCAVALHRGVFHLIVPDNGTAEDMARGEQGRQSPGGGKGYHATSQDGLTFERMADVTLPARDRWLGNVQSRGDQLCFFGTGPGPWPVTSADGKTWDTAPEAERLPGADPGAVLLKDGSWLVVVTGPPRQGTAGDRRRGRGGAGPQPFADRGPIRVELLDSKYAKASSAKPGRFVTGQDADLVLGAKGFDESGGPLLFNHPSGLATDGKALAMTDRWNNRVLVWRSAPAKNTPPDLVLGQPDFHKIAPGTGRGQLNWPGNVTLTPDGKVAVTDTNNDRILIWNALPQQNGAPADLVLDLARFSGDALPGAIRLAWPWGVWSDGKKLAVVATHGASVLIWNVLPGRDDEPPDLVLRPPGAGTPRNVTSDGATFFAVSDHNWGIDSRPATMIWRGVPASAAQPPDFTWNEWVKGSFAAGKLVVGGMRSLWIWNQAPQSGSVEADVVLSPRAYRNGDGPDAVVAGGRLYACNYNGNNVLGWNAIPARDDTPPDFALGSETPEQDTWAESSFIQNGVVATDGKSLFVSSDFDRKMFVWRELPDESAAKPDLVFHLPEGPQLGGPTDNELHGQTLVLAGKSTVYVWRKLPLHGEPPDQVLSGRIGGVELAEISGVAFDEKHFYLADRRAEAIFVWDGIPKPESEPVLTLRMKSPGRLDSDGTWLTAAPFEGSTICLWRVAELGASAAPVEIGGRGAFNLPSQCLIAEGRVFVADRSNHRVVVWGSVEDALAGRPAEALLGGEEKKAAIGKGRLFMPGSIAFGGGYLWVAEFKFSTRILRFSPRSLSNGRRRG